MGRAGGSARRASVTMPKRAVVLMAGLSGNSTRSGAAARMASSTHSGLAPLLDAARENVNVKVFILDNAIVAMTGGQPTQATDEQVVDLVAGLGVPRAHIRVVEPTHHKKAHTVAVIREELAHDGVSVIIARRACVTYAKEIKVLREQRAAHGGCAEGAAP